MEAGQVRTGQPEGPSIWRRFWYLMIGGGLVLFVIVALTLGVFKDSSGEQAASSTSSEKPAPPTFGTEQNDKEGYSGIAWETTYKDFEKQVSATSKQASPVPARDTPSETVAEGADTSHEGSSSSAAGSGSANADSSLTAPSKAEPEADSAPSEPSMNAQFIQYTEPQDANKLIAKLIGVPNQQRSIGPVTISSINWNVVPRGFYSDKKDDVEFVFYNGKIAMALSQLNAHNYDAVRADLASKYPQVDSISDSWDEQQLEEQPDKGELQAILFKRAPSNTRIYLIQYIFHATGLGYKTTSTYLLYVPNSAYEAIRADISRNLAVAEGAAQAERRKSEQPDTQKVQ